jgi:hypothetical protein
MIERRQYVRMNTVFPVEIELSEDTTGEKGVAGLLQAFTRDVSAGGMCLELKSFDKHVEKRILPDISVDLTINTTFAAHPIRAQAKIVWLRREVGPLFRPHYRIGIQYTEIDDKARRRIIKHARRLIWIPRAALVATLFISILLGGLFWHNQQLLAQNVQLVNELVSGAERRSSVAGELYVLHQRKAELDRELTKAQQNIQRLQNSIASLTAENMGQKNAYERRLQKILAREKTLGSEMETIKEGKAKLKTVYRTLVESEKLTASKVLRQMYAWLQSHQNLHTNLVASFEGDALLEDWAFTYDQALASQTFLLFGDVKNAEQILSFYDTQAQKEDGAFFNSYDASGGHPIDHVIHAGPNLWLGMAALQYEHRQKDGRFLPLAKRIGKWAMDIQDEEGGLRGGPKITWYSTEHNLDAYAFFNMLHRLTGDDSYKQARNRVLEWLKKYAYTQKERRLNRGKGDATIATDTFSWAIASLGPATLKEIDFDPEAIVEFAEKNCEVEVTYKQPSGRMAQARGFDFARAQHIGRGGVISTEWTAQMVVTYQILSRYFGSLGSEDRAEAYAAKSNFYLNELQKLIITSPSRTGQGRGCLPYASHDDVDTGHGWRTPKGRRTGSVAATAYGIFAWTGYNPFDLDSKKEIR